MLMLNRKKQEEEEIINNFQIQSQISKVEE
jgi:hypothetical protein